MRPAGHTDEVFIRRLGSPFRGREVRFMRFFSTVLFILDIYRIRNLD